MRKIVFDAETVAAAVGDFAYQAVLADEMERRGFVWSDIDRFELRAPSERVRLLDGSYLFIQHEVN